MADRFVGLPRGLQIGGTPGFEATLHHDLARIARMLDDLQRKKLSRAAESAVRQTLADMVHGISEETRGQYVVRTAVNDHNTCVECARLDGRLVRFATEEYAAYRPPNFCLGGQNCRCVYDPVLPGRAGIRITTAITESTMDAVRGEIRAHVTGSAEPSTARLAAIAKTRASRSGPRTARASEQSDAIEAQRIIRDAMVSGKPALQQHLLRALEQLAATGVLPVAGAMPAARDL